MADDLPPVTGHGAKDRERYKAKIEEALKKGMKDVITGENVISAPDGQKVRIKVADIHEPRFRAPRYQEEHGQCGQTPTTK